MVQTRQPYGRDLHGSEGCPRGAHSLADLYVSNLAPGHAYLNAVTGDYFATLGTTVLRGRSLTDSDGGSRERVAVVNETSARLLWPGQDPLGRCLQVGSDKGPCARVVGVVEDVRRNRLLPEPPTLQVYVPLGQEPSWVHSRALFVRQAGDVASFAAALRREVQRIAPGAPYVDVTRLTDRLDPQARTWVVGAALLSLRSARARPRDDRNLCGGLRRGDLAPA